MIQAPSKQVLREFRVRGPITPLDGGEGRAWRGGDVVLKPCDTPMMWLWLAQNLPTVDAVGFRLPLPLCAVDGRWVVDGWCAQEAVAGEHPRDGRWHEVLEVGERFHAAVMQLRRPEYLDDRADPWAFGDRVAWEEIAPPSDHEPLNRLLSLRHPLSLSSQLIHGDLTENVLFADQEPPAVIDVSPYWRPRGFASAIIVADAVCWRNADPAVLLERLSHIDQFPQLLVRALIYRMVTTIAVARGAPALTGYQAGIDLAVKLVEAGNDRVSEIGCR